MDIRIGHASSAMQSILPKILKGLKKNRPGVQAVLVEGTNKLIFEKLLHRELELGIVPNAIPPKDFGSKVIYRENFVLILPSDHPLTMATFKDLSDCADNDWIMPPRNEGYGYVEILYRIFQQHGFLPNVVHQTPNASSALRLVEAGLGVNIIGKSALNGISLNIKHIELSNIEEKVEMRLVWLNERELELSKMIDVFSGDCQP
jgi:DNA-binding transcriptional LysR family regulator